MSNDFFPCNADWMRSFHLPQGKVFTENRIIFSIFVSFRNKSPLTNGAYAHKHLVMLAYFGITPISRLKSSPSKVSTPCIPTVLSPGSLPLRRRMDDEEEDMSLPTSQLRVLPFGDVKQHEQWSSSQTVATVTAAAVVATSQDHGNHGINAVSCSIHLQPHVPFNGKEWGDILTLNRKNKAIHMQHSFLMRARLLKYFILFKIKILS